MQGAFGCAASLPKGLCMLRRFHCAPYGLANVRVKLELEFEVEVWVQVCV